MFHINIFKHEDGSNVEEKIEEILEEYFGNSTSTKSYTFQNEKEYSLVTLGSHKNMFSEPYLIETGTSFVLGSVTEIILPWVAVAMEIESSTLKKTIKDSISKDACKIRMTDFVTNLWPKIGDVMETYASDGLGETIKDFSSEIIIGSMLDEDGILLIGCLAKNIINVQKVRSIIVEKIAKYVGTGSVGFWVDVINAGASIFNASSSTILFIQSMVDDSISPNDNYKINIEGDNTGYYLSLSNNQFHSANSPYVVDYSYNTDGVMAYVKAWDNGNATQYTQSYYFYIRPQNGNFSEVKDIDVTVNLEHEGQGRGCSSIHYWAVSGDPSTYTTVFEKCSSDTFHIRLKTNFRYRMETNAQYYSRSGELGEHRTQIKLILP